jgi:hypothetical protein
MNKKQIAIGALVIVAAAAAILVILLSIKAINANKLTCSSGNESNGVKIEQKYAINFSKDTVKSVTITKMFAYTDQKQFDAFKSVVIPGNDSKMNELKNDNIRYTSSVKDKTYRTETTINVDKASKTDIAEVGVDKSLKT